MAFNPVEQLFLHSFRSNFYYAPQQRESVFWNKCQPEVFRGAQAYVPIFPQVDGIDYDPHVSTGNYAKTFSEVPFSQIPIKQVGFRIRAHTLNHAIPRTDFYRLSANYRNDIPSMFATSAARFRDRVILYNVDGPRPTLSGLSATAHSTTWEAFPAKNKYVISKFSGGNYSLERLDLETLLYMNLAFKNNNIMNRGVMPVCVASPYQINNLLNADQLTSADYNTVKTLVRGEVNSFMGFEFLDCRAQQTKPAADVTEEGITYNAYTKQTAAGTRYDVVNAATSGYTVVPEAEKIVFAMPYSAFSCGELPEASYMNVWANPLRQGVWEYQYSTVVGYRRKQNEYVFVAYAEKLPATGFPNVEYRKTPEKKLNDYYNNFDLTGTHWNFTAKTAA